MVVYKRYPRPDCPTDNETNIGYLGAHVKSFFRLFSPRNLYQPQRFTSIYTTERAAAAAVALGLQAVVKKNVKKKKTWLTSPLRSTILVMSNETENNMNTMTYDAVQSLWDTHAFADDDRRTELADISLIAHDLRCGRCPSHIINREQWDNIVDDLHREHSEIEIDDLAEYLRYVAAEVRL